MIMIWFKIQKRCVFEWVKNESVISSLADPGVIESSITLRAFTTSPTPFKPAKTKINPSMSFIGC